MEDELSFGLRILPHLRSIFAVGSAGVAVLGDVESDAFGAGSAGPGAKLGGGLVKSMRGNAAPGRGGGGRFFSPPGNYGRRDGGNDNMRKRFNTFCSMLF